MIVRLINKKYNLFIIKVHSVLNNNNLHKMLFYFLKSKFLQLLYIKDFTIYTSKFPFFFILLKLVYQRTCYFTSSAFSIKNRREFLFTEFLFKQTLQYLTKSNSNK